MAYDFDKKNNEKIQEEAQRVYDESAVKLAHYSKTMKRAVMISSLVFLLSYVGLLIVSALYKDINGGAGAGNYTLMLFQFLILPVFLYDPKEDDKKKAHYETDMRVILKDQVKRVTVMKVKVITFICLVTLFFAINIGCWLFIYSNVAFEF